MLYNSYVTGNEEELSGSVGLRGDGRELPYISAANPQLAPAGDPQDPVEEGIVCAIDHAAVDLAGVDVAGCVAPLAELEELTLGVEGSEFGAYGEAAAVHDVLDPERDVVICTAPMRVKAAHCTVSGQACFAEIISNRLPQSELPALYAHTHSARATPEVL